MGVKSGKWKVKSRGAGIGITFFPTDVMHFLPRTRGFIPLSKRKRLEECVIDRSKVSTLELSLLLTLLNRRLIVALR
jgi:hypothetical protein